MRVVVRYHAFLKDRLGKDREVFELPEGASVADLGEAWLARHPGEERILDFARFAVRDAYATGEEPLEDGEEVDMIPPVSGGCDAGERRPVALTREPMRAGEAEEQLETAGAGAVVTFRGVIRKDSEGGEVEGLHYEAQESMALRLMNERRERALARGDVTDVAIWHRLGTVGVGGIAVEVAVASPHRAAAFEVAREAIEAFKEEIPVFKKDLFRDGEAQWREEG